MGSHTAVYWVKDLHLFDSVTLTPHHHMASSLVPILIAVRGHRLTINNHMGHTKLLAQITYTAVFQTSWLANRSSKLQQQIVCNALGSACTHQNSFRDDLY